MRTAAALVVLLVPAAAAAQTSFPMVTHVNPVAVQRGTTAEVTVECRTSSLAGVYRVLVEGEGVSIEAIPPKEAPKVDPKTPAANVTAIKLKITVAPTAKMGVREFRVAC